MRAGQKALGDQIGPVSLMFDMPAAGNQNTVLGQLSIQARLQNRRKLGRSSVVPFVVLFVFISAVLDFSSMHVWATKYLQMN